MNPKKFAIIIFLVIIVAAGSGSFLYTMYRLRNHQEFLTEEAEIKQIENAEGEKITLTETKNGKRNWVIKMDRIKYNKDKSIGDLTGVKGLIYDDKQDVLFIFTAPEGKYYRAKGRIDLTKGAKMRSPEAKITITAPEMIWSLTNADVLAKGGVKMVRKGAGYSQGDEAHFNMDFSEIDFRGKVTSVF